MKLFKLTLEFGDHHEVFIIFEGKALDLNMIVIHLELRIAIHPYPPLPLITLVII